MKTIVTSLLLILFVTGCATKYPSITEYRIKVEPKQLSDLQKSCEKKSLTVAQVFVPSALMSKSMKYVVGEYKEYAYNTSAWAENPNRAITSAIVKSLQNTQIFQTVENYKSFSRSDYTLESRVDDFSQHFDHDEKHSFAVVDMTFSLIENKTAKVVATKHIIKKEEVKEANANSGVEALNKALNETLTEMSSWISGSCL